MMERDTLPVLEGPRADDLINSRIVGQKIIGIFIDKENPAAQVSLELENGFCIGFQVVDDAAPFLISVPRHQ